MQKQIEKRLIYLSITGKKKSENANIEFPRILIIICQGHVILDCISLMTNPRNYTKKIRKQFSEGLYMNIKKICMFVCMCQYICMCVYIQIVCVYVHVNQFIASVQFNAKDFFCCCLGSYQQLIFSKEKFHPDANFEQYSMGKNREICLWNFQQLSCSLKGEKKLCCINYVICNSFKTT